MTVLRCFKELYWTFLPWQLELGLRWISVCISKLQPWVADYDSKKDIKNTVVRLRVCFELRTGKHDFSLTYLLKYNIIYEIITCKLFIMWLISFVIGPTKEVWGLSGLLYILSDLLSKEKDYKPCLSCGLCLWFKLQRGRLHKEGD